MAYQSYESAAMYHNHSYLLTVELLLAVFYPLLPILTISQI